ncbi:splicing factor 3a, subunit 1 [Perkinsus chesapeaki]|uniref:Splicing factor 3a, subunit 1 n=1 Tax=Perkinsus chesapeaki TaxID=330153 RepID=A0A7J6LNK5_PERCH|nr:splicing factor 3a, subunit 1 [Perkinsus chesapeaki]
MSSAAVQSAAMAAMEMARGRPGARGTDDTMLIYPPADIKSVVDKTAEFVAKHGDEFERRVMVQQAKQAKFAFLTPGNPYRKYYEHRVQELREGVQGESGPAMPKELEDYKKKEEEKRRKREERKMLTDGLAREVKPPPPDVYSVEHPFIAPIDMDIIKITAQFTAKNGNRFLQGLAARESRNPQFDFVKPNHPLFGYFQALVDSYTRALLPPPDDLERIKSYAKDKSSIVDRVMGRFQYDEQEARRKADKEQREKEERIQMAAVDWHSFVVVETIDFKAEDDELPLPPPILGTTGKRPVSEAPQTLVGSAQAARAVISKEKEVIGGGGAGAGPTFVQEEEEMEIEDEGEEMQMDDMPPEMAKVASTSAMRADVERQDEEEEEPPAEALPLPELAPAPAVVRTDYHRKPKRAVESSEDDGRLVKCPITGQMIRASELSEHLRVVLLDPKWKEQKEKAGHFDIQDTNYDQANIESNLASFIIKRPDLFGTVEEEIEHQASVAAEQSMMTASYDAGPQASNVTDAANQMPGLFGARGGLPGKGAAPRRPMRSGDVRYNQNFQNECNVKSEITVPPPPETQIFWDSHCHLDWIMLKSGMGRAINRNKIAVKMDLQLPKLDGFASDNFGESFGGCVIAGFGLSTVHSTIEILEFAKSSYFLKDKVYGAFGCHPHCCEEYNDEFEKAIIDATHHPRAVALGECGLDYFGGGGNVDKEIQKKVFATQLGLKPVKDGMPVVLHLRCAESDSMRIMKQHLPREHPIHVHCFSDSPRFLRAIATDFPNAYFGYAGVVSFVKNRDLQESVRITPVDRLVLETDGPYLAPEPYRGNVAHCGMIPVVAHHIARIKGIEDVDGMIIKCTENTRKLYRIDDVLRN